MSFIQELQIYIYFTVDAKADILSHRRYIYGPYRYSYAKFLPLCKFYIDSVSMGSVEGGGGV